jgi:hypothetical protein
MDNTKQWIAFDYTTKKQSAGIPHKFNTKEQAAAI